MVISLDYRFWELFGQIGATVVSIIATLFVGYLVYLKEQRDRIGNEILELKRRMSSIVEQIRETPIPGVIQSLLSSQPEEQRNRLSITRWTAGTSWDMRVRVGEVNERDIWDNIRQSIEDLVRAILPDGHFPEISMDSETFREWARNIIENTNHIEWFCHETDQYRSWYLNFLTKMVDWESTHPNPVLNSQTVALLIQRILTLRHEINEDLHLENRYQQLKIENAIQCYQFIIIGFVFMAVSSIVIPLLMLLTPHFEGIYIVSWLSLLIFLISSTSTIYFLLLSSK